MHAKIVPNTTYSWDKQGKMSNTAVVSFDELKAAVDEAHKNGMFVATHSFGGSAGLKDAIAAGVDDIQHATAADDDDIKALVAKHLPVTSTILDLRQDEPADLIKSAPFSKFREMQKTWVKMMKAGVTARVRQRRNAGHQWRRPHLRRRVPVLARRAGRALRRPDAVGRHAGLRAEDGDQRQRGDPAQGQGPRFGRKGGSTRTSSPRMVIRSRTSPRYKT